MKIAIAAVLGLVTVLGGSLAYNKGSTTSTQPKPTEVVSVPSPQVNSVMTNSTDALVSQTKSVIRQTLNKDRVIYLNGEVTYELSQYLSNRIKELNAKSSDDIFLLIDSPGGSVLDGATLTSEIEASKAHVNTVCTRLCASMAAMIHSYGYKRYSTDRSILMYHPASGGAQGQVPNMLSQLTTMSRYIAKMVANSVSRSKMSSDEFNKLVAYELWIDAEDATNRGLNDGIVNLNVPGAPELSATANTKEKSDNTGFQWISPHPELWKH